ncbi:hypothetical protein BBJ28_00003566 [Nothophytophthora sp. Chile5]|nr:hypothetical protein BBJ28_00003566 [Nothophytophthora sp. Chile5]
MTWWEYRMDRIAEGTRWRSSSAGLIQTHDAVGDALIMELREAARAAEDDRNISRWSFDLLQRFVDYDDERRLLVKLADTGRILQLLQRAIETTLGVLGICEETTATTWREHLQHERERRVAFYEASIVDERRMTIEMGDETQQIEVLTLMKHGLEKFGEVLTPSELDEISAGFDIVSRRSGFAVGRIPVWFATSRGDWTDARKSSVGGGGEETCLREVAIWKQLHHPHVRKFYGADADMEIFLGCALGLVYIHERGLVHQRLSAGTFLSLRHEREGALSALPFQPTPFSQLPSVRPDFLTGQEWELLLGMCAPDPASRTSMAHVVQTMKAIAKEQEKREGSTSQAPKMPPELVQDVQFYICPLAGQTIEELLGEADEMCDQTPEFASVTRPVYGRLMNVYQQLVADPGPLPADLIEEHSDILWRFYLHLEQRSSGDFSRTAALCASRTIANWNCGLHHDIDRIILRSPALQQTSSIHQWQPTWERARQQQRESLQTCLENPSLFLDQLDSEAERAEALALMQCETRDHRGSYSPDALAMASDDEEAGQLDVLGGEGLPLWFIPPYQVELGKHLADGSFGSVCEGRWLGADVVVKQVLTDQAERENREQFRQEVDLWFTLNDRHLLKLRCGSCLHQAMGLEHLHECGIVHGDLKASNILCVQEKNGPPVVKLADFGLSGFPHLDLADSDGAVDAFRWKAPECLSGASPTFASDVYSLGMCIIEAVTGEFPWGNAIPDAVVKYNVIQKKLPARPLAFDDVKWDLVERMCCFKPEERISAGAVAQIVKAITGW